jgi:hypothetical protein
MREYILYSRVRYSHALIFKKYLKKFMKKLIKNMSV